MKKEKLEEIFLARGLSKAERLVAHEIISGASNKMAANKLFLSEKTVKFHNTNLNKKFRTSSKSEFIARVQEIYMNEVNVDDLDIKPSVIAEIKKELSEIKEDIKKLAESKKVITLPTGY